MHDALLAQALKRVADSQWRDIGDLAFKLPAGPLLLVTAAEDLQVTARARSPRTQATTRYASPAWEGTPFRAPPRHG